MADTLTTHHNGGNGMRTRIKLIGSLLLVITLALSVSMTLMSIDRKEAELEKSLARHQLLAANGRAELVSTWLANLAQQGERLINADMFRLFASEVNMLTDLSQLLGQQPREAEATELSMLADQLPMMEGLLREFVSYSGFLSGRIVNSDGHTYIATDASVAPLGEAQAEIVASVLQTPAPHFGNVRRGNSGLEMDMFLPVFPPQFEKGEGKPVGVLMLTRIISGKISEFVGEAPAIGTKLHTRLVQKSASGFVEVAPWLPEGLRNVSSFPVDSPDSSNGNLQFGMRESITGEGAAYSSGVKVPDLNWWIVEESDYAAARAELDSYTKSVTAIAILVTLALALLIGGLWWWLVGVENRQVAEEFKLLAQTIQEQKAVLDSINNTITDFIALKSDDGTYLYVNPAFANAVGRTPEDMVGLDDAAIFGFETARRLKNSDDLVRLSQKPVTVDETIYLQSRKYHVQVSKAPFCADDVCDNGIVSVFRDVTAAVEAQERNKRVVKQTVSALVRTIEHTDPYLGGHTRMMESLSVELARAMNLPETDLATVEAAANLSQVGKMFVPQEILNKPGALTNEEKHLMEQHVEHAKDVLSDIDFELPVVDAIYQMNEKLDGTGYPAGLSGEDIMMPAQILGLTNTFCALVRPRSYRPAKPVEVAMDILEELKHQYDIRLTNRLKEIVQSPMGERLLTED